MSDLPRPWEEQNYNAYIQQPRGIPSNIGRSQAPPLPPRRYQNPMMSYYPRYGGMGSYGGFGMGYGAMGGYSPYSRYGGTYGSTFENRFAQLAEESASPTFEAIESFVRGFTALNMMLESTYQALHMSFRAALSVAENMSKIRSAVIGTLASISILRRIKLFYKRLLHLLGLVNKAELSWHEAQLSSQAQAGSQIVSKSSPVWPILAFFGAIIAGPALIYKFLIPKDAPAEEEELQLIATHDFVAEQNGEMSFRKGEVMTTQRSGVKRGWILAKRGNTKGYIPSNRVKIYMRQSTDGQPPSDIHQPQPAQPQLNFQNHNPRLGVQNFPKLPQSHSKPPLDNTHNLNIPESDTQMKPHSLSQQTDNNVPTLDISNLPENQTDTNNPSPIQPNINNEESISGNQN